MTKPPSRNPAIYHITHVGNLASIISAGRLWSDSERLRQGLGTTGIGYSHIKQRRLRRRVDVAAGGYLGEYVPFYFCNRSVMLYVISRGHEDYTGGQEEVIHLVSSVNAAVASGQQWAFTERHAELSYAQYFDDLQHLDEVDWTVMPERYWSEPDMKERRQAEFLVHRQLPWTAIERIGVQSGRLQARVQKILKSTAHQPPVNVEPGWYY